MSMTCPDCGAITADNDGQCLLCWIDSATEEDTPEKQADENRGTNEGEAPNEKLSREAGQ